MDKTMKKRQTVLNKELRSVEKQERKLEKAAIKAKPPTWKQALEAHIPEKVYFGLESAFCKGFRLVFDRGRGLIERTYKKDTILADQQIRDYAIQVKGGKKEWKQVRTSAKQADRLNLAVTTLEGIGLGALGIGLPDVVLFLSTLLRGVYMTALNYGFSYDSREEQYLILKMMEASLAQGETWRLLNEEVDDWMQNLHPVTEKEFQKQLTKTASCFAVDMLLLKFIQGLPVVGILGGAANPVYYDKVQRYVQLKYRKRHLLKREAEENRAEIML